MRHLYLVGLLTVFSCHTKAQTFQKSLGATGTVPITISSDYNPGYSVYSNYNNYLHNVEAPFMNGLLEMYEATKDAVYLDRFMEHAYNVIQRRDDNLALDPSIPLSGLSGVPAPVRPVGSAQGWSGRLGAADNWYVETVNQGTITFPLAKFAYMVKVKYPALQLRPAPSTIQGPVVPGTFVINNFADCAEFLKIKVNQTFGYLSNFWYSADGLYKYDADGDSQNSSTDFRPIIPNQMGSIGRTQIYMHKIYDAEGDNATSAYYLDKVQKMAARFMNYSNYYFTRDVTNHVVSWRYMNTDSKMEDIAHGLLLFEFADLCNLFNLKQANGVTPIFDNSMMYDLANTFKVKLMQNMPLKYSMSITGWDNDQTQLINGDGTQLVEGDDPRYNQYMNAGRYLFLARHIPDIYNMIADYFYEFGLYGPGTYPMYIEDKAYQCAGIDAVGMLANGRTVFSPVFQNYLDIQSVKRTPTYHAGSDVTAGTVWKAVAAGKFDANRTVDLFVTANAEGKIQLREFDPTTKKISNSLSTYINYSADWGGITAGDFIAGNNQSEFVALNKTDKKLYLFRYDGTGIVTVASFTTNIGINWTGIASGNLDGTSTDEIVMLASNGQVYVYRITGTGPYSLNGVAITNSSTSAYVVSQAAKIAVGNLDNNLANGLEIVTLSNSADYNIKVLNYTFSGPNMTFTSVIPYLPASGNVSQWDGLTTGDFNADGYDEIMMHRDSDGDFHIQYLDGGIVKSLCKENFPTHWDLGIMCSTSFPGSSIKHVISLRNIDGHIFTFKPFNLPAIPSRPAIPVGPGKDPTGMMQNPANEMNARMSDVMVYPNPTNGVIQVVLPQESTGKMTVISPLGQVILDVQITDSNRNQKVDLSDYPAGIYLLKVETPEEIFTKKIRKE